MEKKRKNAKIKEKNLRDITQEKTQEALKYQKILCTNETIACMKPDTSKKENLNTFSAQ